MKSFLQFSENLEQRRQIEIERRRAQREAQNARVSEYQETQAAKRAQRQNEIESEKRERLAAQRVSELERKLQQLQQQQQAEELQLEQTPILKQKPFNVLKAREQAKSGPSHRKHVHSELSKKEGAEESAQESAHLARLKSIMSRE